MGQGKGQSKDAGRKPEARACHYCGKIGHLAADCHKKARDQKGQGQSQVNNVQTPQQMPTADTS
eukprot:6411842-Amphidinium_carterae.1